MVYIATQTLVWGFLFLCQSANAVVELSNRLPLRECLVEAVRGDNTRIRLAEDTGFLANDVKPFNLNLQYLPFAVTYPNTADEVAAIVTCASLNNRKIQARSGGRDFINKCIGGADGGIVVDLRSFTKVQVNSLTNTARVGPGNLLGDLTRGLHGNGGRYIPHGSSPTVGVGGHFAVGGMGYSSRQNGLSIDAVQEIEVVLANGTIVRAAEDENADLLWAMRGAGASFGIATEFTIQTKEEPTEVVEFVYSYESDDPAVLGNALKAYYNLVRDEGLSLQLGGTLRFTNTSLVFSGGFFGSEAEFHEVELGNRLAPTSSTSIIPGLSWIEFMNNILESGGSTNNPAHFAIEDTVFTRANIPTDETLDVFLEHVYNANADSAQWSFLFDLYGGAMSQVAPTATAFPHRDALICLTAYARTENDTSAKAIEFMDEAVLKLQAGKPDNFGSYAGVPSLSLGDKAQKKYWGANLERLEEIKAEYDPSDSFSTPQGVKPAMK